MARITQLTRETFITAIMNDTVMVDHDKQIKELLQADAAKSLPAIIKEILTHPKHADSLPLLDRNHVTVRGSDRSDWSDSRSFRIVAYNDYQPSAEVKEKVRPLIDEMNASYSHRAKLRKQLEVMLRRITTYQDLKAWAATIPGADKHLPPPPAQQIKGLPATTDLIPNLIAAGFPQTQQRAGEQLQLQVTTPPAKQKSKRIHRARNVMHPGRRR